MPSTAQPSCGRPSTRMPASLRPSTSTSFGHLIAALRRATRLAHRHAAASGRAPRPAGAAPPTSAAPARAAPTRCGPGGRARRVCSSAVTSVPCGAPARGQLLGALVGGVGQPVVDARGADHPRRAGATSRVGRRSRASPAASPRFTARRACGRRPRRRAARPPPRRRRCARRWPAAPVARPRPPRWRRASRPLPASRSWPTLSATLPNRSMTSAWATSVPSSSRGSGSSSASSVSGSSGSPASAELGAGGELGGHGSEHVAAVEGGRHRLEPVRASASRPPPRDAAAALPGEAQQAVVRAHQQAPVGGLRAPPRGARCPPAGPPPPRARRRAGRAARCAARAPRAGRRGAAIPWVMSTISRLGGDRADHAVADAHELVVVAVVGEEA